MKNQDKENRKISVFLRFSGLAFQMGALIVAAAFGGRALDERSGNSNPIWTIVLILLAIFVSLYQIIREVIKVGKEND